MIDNRTIRSFQNLPKRRHAEFIKPPNLLKEKVGSGGLSDKILQKAQLLLENHRHDFRPIAEMYLRELKNGISSIKKPYMGEDPEYLIALILYPVIQLKANGEMFHYKLVTIMADQFAQFLEVIDDVDDGVMEIADAFYNAVRAIISSEIKGDGGEYGAHLLEALSEAYMRYFEKKRT